MAHKLYWIHHKDHTDFYTQGYIGVTGSSLRHRWSNHISAYNLFQKAENKRYTNSRLRSAFTKYNPDNLIMTCLVVGSEDYVYELEKILRPDQRVGWNTAIGGKCPRVEYHTYTDDICIEALTRYVIHKESAASINDQLGVSETFLGDLFHGNKRPLISKKFKELFPDVCYETPSNYSHPVYSDELLTKCVYDYLYLNDSLESIEDKYGIPHATVRLVSLGKSRPMIKESVETLHGETYRVPIQSSIYKYYEVSKLIDCGLDCKDIATKTGMSKANINKFKNNKMPICSKFHDVIKPIIKERLNVSSVT